MKSDGNIVVHEIGPGTWSIQEKAVPGFRLSSSTMEALNKERGPDEMKDYIENIDDEDTILFLADAVYAKATRLHKQAEEADARLEEILDEIRNRGLFDKWVMLNEHN